jgi:hypothetical protein
VLALRSADAYADAYGLLASPPHDGLPLVNHLKGGWWAETPTHRKHGGEGWSILEVTFDEGDILGTFPAYGAPGVVGLWLGSYSEGSEVAGSGNPDGLLSLDLTDYTVPDLRPAANGYMDVRGFVWTPDSGKQAYP